MVGLVAFAIVSGAVAGDSVKKSDVKVPSVKSGKCSITLLDADGIKPLAGAKLKIQSLKDTKKIVSAEANQAGLCKVDLEKGRYVLSVNDKMLTLLDVEKNGQLAWCRIVVSAKPMLIGGQAEAAEGASGGFTFMGLSGGAAYAAAGAVGIVAVGAVGGGGYLIYDNNRDDDDDDKATTPPPAAPPADERPPSASR
jgi:hypothetical protein